jgi:hypothetical protein
LEEINPKTDQGFRVLSANAAKVDGNSIGMVQLLGDRFGIDGDLGLIIAKLPGKNSFEKKFLEITLIC